MRVLMLGWEFPPFITGGLGTACYGLTRALDARGVQVTFVLPRPVGDDESSHVQMVSPATEASRSDRSGAASARTETDQAGESSDAGEPGRPRRVVKTDGSVEETTFEHVSFLHIPAGFRHPYPQGATGAVGEWQIDPVTGKVVTVGGEQVLDEGTPARPGSASSRLGPAHGEPDDPSPQVDCDYGGDLMNVVHQYARFCAAATRGLQFDVIHAHDWLTYPAALRVARQSGKPLICHIHSTEFDRSGSNVNQPVYDIERRGLNGAIKVIAVSQLTKNICVHRYGVSPERVEVVYNGVEIDPVRDEEGVGIRGRDKIVLYFGRITHQKGPEYFLRAAKRVLEVKENVKFVVAGSGDMAQHMIEMAAHLGIGHKVLFTGFLRGKDISRVFAMADLYVMPSVSEPFGIAPLEAMSHDVPVLISKTSGVSEVLTHALKVDFWDIDDMANKIVAVLKYPPLSKTLQEHGRFEVRRLTWDGAAQRCEHVYRQVIESVKTHRVTV